MFKRYTGVGIITALCALFFACIPTSTFATGEIYSWSDYSKIGGRAGAYKEAVNSAEGGTSAIEFTQDSDNHAVFQVEPGVEKCNGTLTLTLSPTENDTGTLTSSGDCPLFSELTKTIVVTRSNLIISKIDSDSLLMKNDFKAESCSEVVTDRDQSEQCGNQVNEAFRRHSSECKTQHDYARATYQANKYLDCLAEKLGVERPSAAEEEEKAGSNSNCSIPDVGWIFCQAIQFLSWITDHAFSLLSNMLEVEPLKEQVNGNDSKLYSAWKVSLGLANVTFVIAFVVMILAYTTNIGLGVYGLKKLTPRLIIAALLVNLSFYICSIAVDLSNILGGTLKNTLVEMTPPSSGSSRYSNWTSVSESVVSITPNDETYTKENKPGATSADDEEANPDQTAQAEEDQQNAEEKELWPPATEAMIGGVALVGGAVLFANLSVLVPFMAAALAAIVTVLIVLIIRQALIVCLIVVAPMAIALFILPNTKQWFDRWLDIFVKLLMIYPAVALVFGASYFASRVILEQAIENSQSFLAMFALGIQVIPLFITPVIMKLGGGALDRFAGVVNNADKGALDRIKKGAAGFREDRKNQQKGRAAKNAFTPTNDPNKSKWGNRIANAPGRAKSVLKNPNGARIARNIKKEAGESALESALSRSKQAAFSNEEAIRSAAKGIQPGEFLDELMEESLAEAAKGLHDIDVDRISATAARFRNSNIDANSLQNMALTGSDSSGNALTEIERAAAIQEAANTAESDKAHDLILASGNMNDALRRILVDSLRKSGFTKQNAHFGGSAMNAVAEGRVTSQAHVDELVRRAAEGGKYSATAISRQSPHALSMLNTAIDQGRVSQSATDRIIENAHTALNTPTLSNNINSNSRPGVERLAR